MSDHDFTFHGVALVATASRALWIAQTRTLCVSDLHLGKAGRIARRAGLMLPPYDTEDTLQRLARDIARFDPATVICLGDSFDDLTAAQELAPEGAAAINALQAGRDWIWVEGNHDPSPLGLGGRDCKAVTSAGLHFQHIATEGAAQVSGHYHPKHGIKGGGPARACFLYDKDRLILPAYGTYTGGLSTDAPVLRKLFAKGAIAVLTGQAAIAVPVAACQPSA